MNMKPNKPKLTALGRLPVTPLRNPVLKPDQAKPKLTALGRLPPTSIAMSAQVKPPVNLRGLGRSELQAPKPSLQGLGKAIPQDGTPTPQAQAQDPYQQETYQPQESYQSSGGGGGSAEPPRPPPSDEEYIEEYTEEMLPERSEEEQAVSAMRKFSQDWESDVPWQEMQGFAGERGYREDSAPKIFAEVINGRLCTTAICPSQFGFVPVTDVRFVDEDTPNGPIFGIDDTQGHLRTSVVQGIKAVKMQGEQKSLELAIEGLVIQSRQGDQNAMGTIVSIREQAKKGNPKARRSLDMLMRYIDAHPVTEDGMGAEPEPEVLFSASVMLANGAPLSKERINQIASTFGAESEKEQKLFFYGVANFKKEGVLAELARRFGEYAKQVLELGKGVGQARAIQLVRLPHTPISAYSADAGWEHGE